MAKCKRYEICGREALDGDELCILHSEDPAKDQGAFHRALDEHREKNGDDFRFLVFPGPVDFMEAVFNGIADFSAAKFTGEALFYGAKLKGKTDFMKAEFHEKVAFFDAEFGGEADFIQAKFKREAIFPDAKFNEEANFGGAEFCAGAGFCRAEFAKDVDFATARFNQKADFFGTDFAEAAYFAGAKFKREADFRDAQFKEEASFIGAEFSGSVDFELARFRNGANFTDAEFAQGANFRRARISGRTMFSSARRDDEFAPISFGHEVDFRDVIVEPSDALAFRDADLSKWRFLGTDLRKVEFTEVKWARIVNRFGIGRVAVYDEVLLLEKKESGSWFQIEQLYRQLKQNYEDRRDYGRAGDFHYGEKEMLRRNPKTTWGLWVLLTLYCWMSGYGERYWRPLYRAGLLLVICTVAYIGFGLSSTPPPHSTLLDWGDWYKAVRYSFQVMTLLKPNDLFPVGEVSAWVHTFESILGPLLIGFFALALRQRLKR